jgi:hypothetical protein
LGAALKGAAAEAEEAADRAAAGCDGLRRCFLEARAASASPALIARSSSRDALLASLDILPLDLQVRYGVAMLWLDGSVEAATACFHRLWALQPAAAPDLYAEVGIALARTGKRSAALSVFAKIVAAPPPPPPPPGAGAPPSSAHIFPPLPPAAEIYDLSQWNPIAWLLPLDNAPSLAIRGTVALAQALPAAAAQAALAQTQACSLPKTVRITSMSLDIIPHR